jgi:hypothetical protein
VREARAVAPLIELLNATGDYEMMADPCQSVAEAAGEAYDALKKQ